MSSAVYLTPNEPISREDWLRFCSEEGIRYSPRTVGRNVFYHDTAEITFGEADWSDLPERVTGGLDFGAAEPPAEARRVTVSTYFMGNLAGVADVVCAIVAQWPCKVEPSPEFSRYLPEYFPNPEKE